MMDAKAEANFIRCAFIDQPDMVLFSRKYMFELADYLESLAAKAELGEAACKCVDAHWCKGDWRRNDSEDCNGCAMQDFCRLRTGREQG